MFSRFRSLIFKLDPEFAHNLAIKALKLNYRVNKKIISNEAIKISI